jgi:hypothetical protein
MSKNVTARIKCPGCEMHSNVGFRPPALFRPAIFQFRCSACQSMIMAKIAVKTQKKGEPPVKKGECSLGVKVIQQSDMLIAMLKEEAEHNAKNVEESSAVEGSPAADQG